MDLAICCPHWSSQPGETVVDVVLIFLREALVHAEGRAALVSEGLLRTLTGVILVALAYLSPAVCFLVLAAAVVRYAPQALTRHSGAHSSDEERQRALEAARLARAALQAAGDRIHALERDLARARQTASSAGNAKIDPTYHAVGLHPGAPDWLIESARRAYRLRLHPDRHPAA